MSHIKIKKFGLMLIFALVAIMLFGCGKKEEEPVVPVEPEKIAVNSIQFDFDQDEQLVLMVGQNFDLAEHIEIKPVDADNKEYTVTSLDGTVVTIDGTQINAIKEGSTYIKLVSNDDASKQDVMKVTVREEKVAIAAPRKLSYDYTTQTITFNSVKDASSYTLKINDVEYELGNSTSFSLNSNWFEQNVYDNLLKVEVKANPSPYAFAYTSSEYRGKDENKLLQIYHASPVSKAQIKGGVLSFEKSDKVGSTAVSLQVKDVSGLTITEKDTILSGGNIFEGQMLNSAFGETTLSLNDFDAALAGQSKFVYVVSNISSSTKTTYGEDVDYYNSFVTLPLSFLNNLEVSMSGTTVSWKGLLGVANYNIYINNELKTSTSNNVFDLNTLEGFNNYAKAETPYNLKVEPVLSADSNNIAKTQVESVVKFNRLANPQINVTENGIAWGEVENTEIYSLTSSYEGKTISLKDVEFSLANYPSGQNYSFTLQAHAFGEVEGVYYISSQTSSIELFKSGETIASIVDYTLTFDTVAEDGYVVEFIVNDASAYKDTVTATGESYSLDLSTFDFKAGQHSIEITHLGKLNENVINSNKTVVSFVQLEAVNTLSIEDATTTVVRTEINKDAKIVLEISGAPLAENITKEYLQDVVYNYNSTNTDGNEYLPAGDYVVKVYVKGDGSSTFSYREENIEVPTASLNFDVLQVPTLTVSDTAVANFSFASINNATQYRIFKVTNKETLVATQANTDFNFELNNGSAVYKVQAIKDSSTSLDSCKSDAITITRLVAPTLTFSNDNDKNIFTKVENNDTNLIAGYEFKHGNNVEPYAFDGVTGFQKFTEGENVFTLVSKAKPGSAGVYYLNSLAEQSTLTLNKISNEIPFSVDVENKLSIVANAHAEEYNLQVLFNVDGTEYVYIGGNGTLTCSTSTMSYTYNQRNKTYVLNLVDENYNEVVVGSADYNFDVKVRFIKPSTGNDVVVNSDYTESKECFLTKIDATSEITVNANNELVIKPTNQDKNYYIRIKMLVGGQELTFVQTTSNVLTCVEKSYELPFVKQGQTYKISLMEEDSYNFIIDEMTADFTMQVAYSHNFEGGATDTDSAYTTSKTINFTKKVTLERNDQYISFETARATYDYTYYTLILNGTETPLYATPSDNGRYNLHIVDIYAEYASFITDGVNSLAVITENLDSSLDTPWVKVVSDTFYFRREVTPTITTIKDNSNNDNNSAMVYVDTFTTSYNKTYIINILDDNWTVAQTQGYSLVRTDADAVLDKLEVNIDNEIMSHIDSFDGDIYVSTKVECVDKYVDNGKDVYVYNSFETEPLRFVRISAPANVKVSNNKLTFNQVHNAVGYEVYTKSGEVYTKLNSTLLLNNEFDITGLSGQIEVVVKAISRDGIYSNSLYSTSIGIEKLAKPIVGQQEGDFVVTYSDKIASLIGKSGVNLTLSVNNTLLFDLNNLADGVSIDETNKKITILAHKILSYNASTITPETLKFKFVVEYANSLSEEGVYYINSDETEKLASGLFAPSNVQKMSTAGADAEVVESISWQESAKNIVTSGIVPVKYQLIIIREVGEDVTAYSSSDPNLLYYNSVTGTYQNYGDIASGTSQQEIYFPSGYDLDGDSIPDVWFKEGSYEVRVRALPKNQISGYEFYASQYAPAYRFKILSSPTLEVQEGEIVWETEDGASEYLVKVYKNVDNGLGGTVETLITTKTVTTPNYDFSDAELAEESGLLSVKVKAISSNENILNSETSAGCYVYRMPKATNVKIDDGDIILTSVAYFSQAWVEFEMSNGDTYIAILLNPQADYYWGGLNVDEWQTWTQETYTKLNQLVNFRAPSSLFDLPSGSVFNVHVTLIGSASGESKVVNSARAEYLGSIQTTKISTAEFNVNSGVLQYNAKGIFTIEDKPVKINYNFNNQASVSSFWSDTIVYKISILANGQKTDIYTVDYYKFIKAVDSGVLSSDEYTLASYMNDLYATVKMGEVIFNVYKDNKINFADYAQLYHYPMTVDNYHYTSSTEYTYINLADGGSFVVDVFMMGGDSFASDTGNVGYITANACDIKPFVRYGTNNLTSAQGMVRYQDKTQYSNNNPVDFPVYRFTIVPINTPTNITKIVYVYTSTLADARVVAERNDPDLYAAGEILFVPSLTDITAGYLLFDLSSYFVEGIYNITVRTLAGVGVEGVEEGAYLLNAKSESTQLTYKKLSDTEFTINSQGALEFNRSYVLQDSLYVYNNNYEITLTKLDDYGSVINTYVYSIDASSDGVEIQNTKMIYNIPSVIFAGGEWVNIEENVKYNIRIRAISIDSYILNGTYKLEETSDDIFISEADPLKTFEFKKVQGVADISVEGGQLRWVVTDLTNYKSIAIELNYVDEDGQPQVIVIRTFGTKYEEGSEYKYHYFDFGDISYPIGKESESRPTNAYINDGVEYSIKVFVAGNQATGFVNSNYSTPFVMERLAKVDSTSIVSKDGILTWTAVEGVEYYEVTVVGESVYTFIVETNELAFEDVLSQAGESLPVGTYSVNVKAVGENKLTGMNSGYVAGFEKLEQVTTFTLSNGILVWDSVAEAQGYKVRFTYTNIAGSSVVKEEILEGNITQIEIPTDIQGTFAAYVNAIGIGEGKVFNGEWRRFISTTDSPKPINAISYNENTHTYTWTAGDEFYQGDKLIVEYEFEEYSSVGVLASRTVMEVLNYRADKTYNYKLSTIGNYNNFSVRVYRDGTGPSAKVYGRDVEFNIYSYGNGTEILPYAIGTVQELLNIKYNPNKYFKLIASIDMSTINYNDLLVLNNSALICENFTGVLDGGEAEKFSLYNFNKTGSVDNIEINNKFTTALFKNITGATIKNLTFGEENVQTVLTNTFDNSSSTDVQMSLIATNATNSVIDNVVIKNTKFVLAGDSSVTLSGKVQVAGLVANAINTTISNCETNVSVQLDVKYQETKESYIASAVAVSTNSSVRNVTADFNITQSHSLALDYVGGVVAFAEGPEAKTKGIYNSTVVFNSNNVKATYVGGVVAFASHIIVENCETSGTIAYEQARHDLYLGGIIGYAESVSIKQGGTSLTLSITLANLDYKYIGAIAGSLNIVSGYTCEVVGSYIAYSYVSQTQISLTSITVGAYGEKASSVNVSVTQK